MTFNAFKAIRPTLALIAVMGTGALAACATVPSSPAGPASTAFNRADFEWSTAPGRGSVQGVVSSSEGGTAYSCVANAGLTPATPFTSARMQTLYGSTTRATLPADVVRARTVTDASEDYRDFVRHTACENNRFSFDNLPDGQWFVILPVRAGEGPVTVMMQKVQVRSGRTVSLVL